MRELKTKERVRDREADRDGDEPEKEGRTRGERERERWKEREYRWVPLCVFTASVIAKCFVPSLTVEDKHNPIFTIQ